jgi:prevent-host-death family protein
MRQRPQVRDKHCCRGAATTHDPDDKGHAGAVERALDWLASRHRNDLGIGIYDARSKLSELIERVQSGEEVVLTRQGEPVARLVPEKRRPKRSRAAAVMRIRAPARKLDIRDVDIRKLIEEDRR